MKPVKGSRWHQLDFAKLDSQLLQISIDDDDDEDLDSKTGDDDHIFDRPRPHCALTAPKTVGAN